MGHSQFDDTIRERAVWNVGALQGGYEPTVSIYPSISDQVASRASTNFRNSITSILRSPSSIFAT